MIIFASCFMIGKAQEWGIFPKCDVGHNYHPSRPLISRMCLLGFYLTLELMFENQTQLPTLALFFLGASFFFSIKLFDLLPSLFCVFTLFAHLFSLSLPLLSMPQPSHLLLLNGRLQLGWDMLNKLHLFPSLLSNIFLFHKHDF